MQTDDVAHRIDYVAPKHVRDALTSLGRIEDVKFSPSNRRLAVAGFFKNRIAVFEMAIDVSQNAKNISLTDVAEFSSTYLNSPHGLDFIDDEKLLVTSREGQACIFELPVGATGSYKLAPLAVIQSDHISTPGSVEVVKKEQGCCEALICNNYVNTVTKHRIDLSDGSSSKNGEIFFKKWLDVPDGVCASRERQWFAVSNHNAHAVFLYENTPSLSEDSDPDGILRCNYYPHGLQFTSDGRFILVADAGSPYVNIYQRDESGWRGVRSPVVSVRVLSDETFLRGRVNPEEGGPKGIDINNAMNVFVTSCETQPLAFFDLGAILEDVRFCTTAQRKAEETFAYGLNKPPETRLRDQKTFEVNYELGLQAKAQDVQRVIWTLTNSRSWRLTAPLRWVTSKSGLTRNVSS